MSPEEPKVDSNPESSEQVDFASPEDTGPFKRQIKEEEPNKTKAESAAEIIQLITEEEYLQRQMKTFPRYASPYELRNKEKETFKKLYREIEGFRIRFGYDALREEYPQIEAWMSSPERLHKVAAEVAAAVKTGRPFWALAPEERQRYLNSKHASRFKREQPGGSSLEALESKERKAHNPDLSDDTITPDEILVRRESFQRRPAFRKGYPEDLTPEEIKIISARRVHLPPGSTWGQIRVAEMNEHHVSYVDKIGTGFSATRRLTKDGEVEPSIGSMKLRESRERAKAERERVTANELGIDPNMPSHLLGEEINRLSHTEALGLNRGASREDIKRIREKNRLAIRAKSFGLEEGATQDDIDREIVKLRLSGIRDLTDSARIEIARKNGLKTSSNWREIADFLEAKK